jgi:signal transduction histidine kinase/ActR/RegA family two-component response regulator
MMSYAVKSRSPGVLLRVGAGEWLIRYARAILGTGVGLVFVAGIASVGMVLRTATADRLVVHTFEVRQTARQLRSALQDAEIGQRGFLLTADNRYLEPFERAEASVPIGLDALRKLTSDNPGQQDLLRSLGPVIDAKMDELRRTVALMRQGQRDDALAMVRSNRGEELMDEIRDRLDTFSRVEIELLAERQADAETLRDWLLALTGISLILAMGLVGSLSLSTQHYIARLRERTAELEAEEKRRREAEDILRQAQKIEAVGQLTGGIAHDFNNLLTIIIGNLDTLRRRLAQVPTGEDASHLAATLARPLDRALQGARSAAQLTHRLLAFSRRQTLEPARLDLNHLVSGMSDLLRRTLGETISVETVLAGGLWPTFADSNQVENALINLAVNARDAMPSGGRLTIETANAYLDEAYALRFGDVAPGQYVLLSVTDSGSGIAPDLLEKVFEPFFTTKPVGEGSGLGLSMVHGFVKQSGGHVRIYSEVGHGTTVKIYLPRLTNTDQPAAAPAAKPASPSPLSRARPQETVLLVEDNDGVREYATSALEDLGYRVLEARDASEALRLLEGEPRVDLLFTDVILPGAIGGRELAAKVLEQRAGLPVLFTTGYTRNAIVHHGRLDANVHLLNKPYTEQDLARKVRELLDGKPIGDTSPLQGPPGGK